MFLATTSVEIRLGGSASGTSRVAHVAHVSCGGGRKSRELHTNGKKVGLDNVWEGKSRLGGWGYRWITMRTDKSDG